MKQSKVQELYEKYFDTIYRICFLYMKNETDSCDMVQETFLKLIQAHVQFETEEKAKAWLIVTASNVCKSSLRKAWRKKRAIYDEDLYPEQAAEGQSQLLELVKSLEDKYGVPVYLYYYEGYQTGEIAKMLGSNPSTIQSRLAKARKILRMELE